MTVILSVEPEAVVPSVTLNDQGAVVSAALDDGGYILAWHSSIDGSGYGIYAQRYDSTGDKVGAEFRVNTTTTGFQIGPSVTGLLDGGFVVTWSSAGQDGSVYGVYGQRYSADGVATGVEFRVNTQTTGSQSSPHVTALSGGGFLVTWTSVNQDDADGTGVFAQRYTAAGTALGAEFQVNTTTLQNQDNSVVVGLDNGFFAVLWNGESTPGGDLSDILIQRYNAVGVPFGGEILVNTTLANSQRAPAVSRLADGGFVVVWYGSLGAGNEIFAQRFNASGNKVGTELHVNTSQSQDQSSPQVAGLSDGGFVVTWTSNHLSTYDVYSQRFDALGNAIGPEMRVNTHTADNQIEPTVVALGDGGYTIAWQSFNQDGSSSGIYSRTYGPATNLNGAQILFGSADADELDGGSGADTMYGGVGDDTYFVNSASDVASEQASQGFDTIVSLVAFNLGTTAHVENLMLSGLGHLSGSGNSLDNILIGNAGNNSLSGAAGADQLSGGGGSDTLNGGDGDDYMAGGDGNDVIYLSPGSDFADGGMGSDSLSAELSTYAVTLNLDEDWAGDGLDNITGLNAIEHLIGSSFSDALIGNGGNNSLDGGLGADTLTGLAGNDVYYVDNAGDLVVEASSGGVDTIRSLVSFSLVGIHVENLKLLDGALNGTGNNANNILLGNAGANVLDGGIGTDVMEGASGNDTYIVDHIGDIAREYSSAGGYDTVEASVTFTLGAHVEYLTLTGSSAINGYGNELGNILTGNDAVNLLAGGLGGDTYVVHNSNDNVVEVDGGGYDLVYAWASYTLAGRVVETAILLGSDAINLTGNGGANELIGNDGNNLLVGLGGHDEINGGQGDDTMEGGTGNDSYVVHNAGDVVIEASGGGTDKVFSYVTFSLAGQNAEILFLLGNGDINGTGNGLSNTLNGNSGNNILNGAGGNDLLTGGLGADLFLFQTGFRADTIQDFNSGEGDKIQLSGLGAYSVTQSGDNVLVDCGGGNIITVVSDTVANVSGSLIV